MIGPINPPEDSTALYLTTEPCAFTHLGREEIADEYLIYFQEPDEDAFNFLTYVTLPGFYIKEFNK